MALPTSQQIAQFGANVMQLAQQKYSKLRGLVEDVTLTGEVTYYEASKPTCVERATGRYEKSPIIETEFRRRGIFKKYFHWGDIVDWKDQEEILIDPMSSAAREAGAAFARQFDLELIDAMLGNAYEGASAQTTVALPNDQKIAIDFDGAGGNTALGLTLPKLIEVRSRFGKSNFDLDMAENQIHMAISQAQLDNLLRTTEITSDDYNTVRALVKGDVDTFLGIKFVRTELLPITAIDANSQSRQCVAWVKSAVKFGVPVDVQTEYSKRPDYSFNWYMYKKMACGGSRAQDNGVIEISCKETI